MKQANYVLVFNYKKTIRYIGAANLDMLTSLICSMPKTAKFRCFEKSEAKKLGIFKNIEATALSHATKREAKNV